MKSSQLATLYAATNAQSTSSEETYSEIVKMKSNTTDQSWRDALVIIREYYCAASEQEKLEINDLLRRACD